MCFIFAGIVNFCLKWFIYLFIHLFIYIYSLCTFVQVDKGLQWGHVKQKPSQQIQAYLRIFWHYQAYFHMFKYNHLYSGTSQLCSDIFRTLCNYVCYQKDTIIPSWTQDTNGTYIKLSEDVEFTSCVQGDRSKLNVKKYGGREW